MSKKDEKICFKPKDFFGSRYRCLSLTHMGREKLYEVLRELSKNHEIKIEFDENADNYFPKGFIEPDEQELGKIKDEVFNQILTDDIQSALKDWWLEIKRGNPETPNWDLISTCKIDGKPGLFLVEAKAHFTENKPNGKDPDSNPINHEHIGNMIKDVKDKLNEGDKFSFGLTHERYYQLSNRFAWTWKLAHLGIPVVLVYLGFINTKEMNEKIFYSHVDFVRSMTTGEPAEIVDPNAWERKFEVGDGEKKTPFIALLRSLECNTFVQ